LGIHSINASGRPRSRGEPVDQQLHPVAQRRDRRQIGLEPLEREQEHLGERPGPEDRLDIAQHALLARCFDLGREPAACLEVLALISPALLRSVAEQLTGVSFTLPRA
jgi:hypothetical protein